MDYRSWLQRQASSHPDAETRRQAQALLNVVGNDMKLDQRFLNQEDYGGTGVTRERTGGRNPFNSGNYSNYSNGYSAYEVNRLINPQFTEMYNADMAALNASNGSQEQSASTQQLGGGFDPYAAAQAEAERKRIQERDNLRGQIAGRGKDIDALYSGMFGDLERLITTRDAELEAQYGDQFKKATDQYTSAIPDIETSYAAIGAADSTDQSDAKDTAKFGFDDTTKQIGENKKADKTKLGNYAKETRTRLTEDRDTAKREMGRAKETEDVSALRGLRDSIEGNLSKGRVTRATLGTDGAARDEITRMTSDSGRYDQAINALDSVLKSSMSGSVKEAAVQAVVDNAGLSDEEKKKVQQQYGNVYAEQAAL